jgi:hypothetical protein
MSHALPRFPHRTAFSFLLWTSSFALLAPLMAGCGGSGTGTTLSGDTQVTLLASSTANDQLSQFSVTVQSLTLTSQ